MSIQSKVLQNCGQSRYVNQFGNDHLFVAIYNGIGSVSFIQYKRWLWSRLLHIDFDNWGNNYVFHLHLGTGVRFEIHWKLRRIYCEEWVDSSFCFSFLNSKSTLCISIGNTKAIAYQKLNVKIEKFCKWFCWAFLATLLTMIFFPLLYTVVILLHFGFRHGVLLSVSTEWVRINFSTVEKF